MISKLNSKLPAGQLNSHGTRKQRRAYVVKAKQHLGTALVSVLRGLHLRPIFAVMRELKKRGVELDSLRALDLFAGTGRTITRDYEPLVKSLEAWEIEPSYEHQLRKNLPKALVRIVDSYEQLDITESRLGLVVADTWTEMFAGHCEHFELFPKVFRVLDDSAVLVLNIMPEWKVGEYQIEHLRRRRDFYKREDVANIPVGSMVEVYENLARQNGFEIRWWFIKDRYLMYDLRRNAKKWRLCHLVLGLEKTSEEDNEN